MWQGFRKSLYLPVQMEAENQQYISIFSVLYPLLVARAKIWDMPLRSLSLKNKGMDQNVQLQ